MIEIIALRFGNDYNVRVLQSNWKKIKEHEGEVQSNTWVLFKDGMTKSDKTNLGGACESWLGIRYLDNNPRTSIPFDTGGAIIAGGNETSFNQEQESDEINQPPNNNGLFNQEFEEINQPTTNEPFNQESKEINQPPNNEFNIVDKSFHNPTFKHKNQINNPLKKKSDPIPPKILFSKNFNYIDYILDKTQEEINERVIRGELDPKYFKVIPFRNFYRKF